MTVCVAAICDIWGTQGVIAASDRMLTAGDIEFERPAPKMFRLGQTVVAMIAGNASAQDEICSRTKDRLSGDGLKIREVVDAYCKEVAVYHLRRCEQEILFPLGMTMESFIRQQRQLGTAFASSVLSSMADIRGRLRMETIIAGMDETGPHIYSIDSDGVSSCNDSAGFAAIGIGARHAESQFMFQHFAPHWHIGPALILLYTAKRRAEVAPGVGSETDMFLIAPKGVVPLVATLVDFFRCTYEVVEKTTILAQAKANTNITEKIFKALEQARQAQTFPSGESSAETPPTHDAQPTEGAPEPNPTDQAPTS